MAENARNATPTVRVMLPFFTPSSSSTFHFLGAISTSVSRRFHAAFLSLKSYLFDSTRLQFIAAINQLITSTILVLTAFLQLKYSNSSPFSTHPTAMNVAVSCSTVYYLASAAALRFPLHHPLSRLAHRLSLSSAYTSIASLASALLPDSAAPFVYAVSGSLLAAELMFFLYRDLDLAEVEVWRWRICRFFDSLFELRRRVIVI